MDTQQLLKKVRQIRITTLKSVTTRMVGSYRSAFRGRGMDFSEIRHYYQGDDVRNIAWKSTAKTRNLFVKDFKEERSLQIFVALDQSLSMNFGSQVPKKEFVAEMTASITFSAARVGDRIGAILFHEMVQDYIPPKASMQNVLRIADHILNNPASGEAKLSVLAPFIDRVVKDPSVILLISDFLHFPSGTFTDWDRYRSEIADEIRTLRKLNQRHEVIPIMVLDPLEVRFPPLGQVPMKDPSTDRWRSLFMTKKAAAWWQQQATRHIQTWKSVLQQAGMEMVFIQTGDDYVRILERYFHKKRAKAL